MLKLSEIWDITFPMQGRQIFQSLKECEVNQVKFSKFINKCIKDFEYFPCMPGKFTHLPY